MNFCLRTNIAYPWHSYGDSYFKGFFEVDGNYYDSESAVIYLMDMFQKDNYLSLLRKLNGCFAFIVCLGKRVFFGTDKLRSLPLFYFFKEAEITIGDDSTKIVNSFVKEPHLDKLSINELKATGRFITGKNTLIKNFYQVRAGECCCYDSVGGINAEYYYVTKHDDFFDDNIDSLKQEFWSAYERTASFLVKALKGRTAVVPLSGGADSRMILSMLKRKEYEKVICFTYGKPNNYEARISKLIAQEFGYRWLFVPYTKKTWKSIKKDEKAKEYINYSSSFSSTPHFQDYPAVIYLKNNQLIPKDSVFVPGHSGDIPNGNHVAELYTHLSVTKQECENSVYRFVYNSKDKSLFNKINDLYFFPECGSPQDYSDVEENVDTKERQAKYIVNSVRVYDFLGYEWLIPLWDNNQFEFWNRVTLNWRYKRKLYYCVVNDSLPSTNDETTTKRVGNAIRKMPIISTIATKISHFLNWWKSPLLMEHIVSYRVFLFFVLFKNKNFTVADLITNELIKSIKREIK